MCIRDRPKSKEDKNEAIKTEDILKENAYLQSEVVKLKQKLHDAQVAANYAATGVADDFASGIRVATVSAVSKKQKSVSMRSSKQTLNVPFQAFDVLPKAGDECVIWIDSHNMYHAISLIENKEKLVERLMGEVLSVEGNQIKIRMPQRNEIVVDMNEKYLKSCHRGSKVVLLSLIHI